MIQRAAVDFETPHAAAAAGTDPPGMVTGAGVMRPPQALSLRLGPLEAGLNAFCDAGAFELGDCARNVHLDLSYGQANRDVRFEQIA